MTNFRHATLAAWCSLLAHAPQLAAQQPTRPPNIVLIVTDDQGYGDLGCHGHPTLRTPRLDAMAAAGRRFTQFYVAAPVCSPSRAALLTGCYPKRVGMHQHVVFPGDDHGLHPDEVTIADALREAGYATGCFGKWHLGHHRGLLPLDQGFDAWFGTPYSNDMAQAHRPANTRYRFRLPLLRDDAVIEWEPDQSLLTRRITEAAIEFIDAHRDAPFFAYVPHPMPHIPLYASSAFAGGSRRGLYGDVIEEIDWSVGAILDALAERDLLEDTLVLFTSDNGPWTVHQTAGGSAGPLRGGKSTNWEGGQRVPLLAHWPGRLPAGSVCRDPMTAMDLLPTLAGLAGVRLADDRPIDGHDARPQLLGEPGRAPAPPFLYYTSHGELAGVRRGPWKLLLDGDQLFHLEEDVGEQWDRASEHPDLVAELRALAVARDHELTLGARAPARRADRVFDPAVDAAPRQR
ncbi:MAG: sulfatase [Planctomycetota bacterium]